MLHESGSPHTFPESEGQNINLQELKERLQGHSGAFKLVEANPGPGEITKEEYMLCDPEGTKGNDFASVILITAEMSSGSTREDFIKEVLDDDAQKQERVEKTLNNLIKLGLLQEKDGNIYSNISLIS